MQGGGILLNGSPLAGKKLYEFRWGMLVPGALNAGGHFVPEAGGRIIRFADYVYSPTAPRIWNLPGYFHPVVPGAKPREKLKLPKPWPAELVNPPADPSHPSFNNPFMAPPSRPPATGTPPPAAPPAAGRPARSPARS